MSGRVTPENRSVERWLRKSHPTNLTTSLKRTAKERKDGEKEVHQVRQTLRQLQIVKL